MKANAEKLKNKFKQPQVIIYLVIEILINAMLYYPMSFAYSLAEGTTDGFQFIYLATYMTVAGAVSGLVALMSESGGIRKFFSGLFFVASILIIVYVIQNLFQSWFGWVLLLFLLGSSLIIFQNMRKGPVVVSPKSKSE
ncbi:hypothetical protein [Candidatus Enterococcus clewellii]|uniref:Uncharacterized protein n=1 Tax=Candidatus Enterococcus clewellii TaxID=1834193 RepID=A0A242K6Y9_9ENTE|nr:hypothetical protein [Enterococcus sp. 9E7_DIV0242]OTP15986.1 hypothetical protein A5888_002200 [Enterococcus sp. 9E7_DIV0242]